MNKNSQQPLPCGMYKRGNFYWCRFVSGGKEIRRRLSTSKQASIQMAKDTVAEYDRQRLGTTDNHFPWRTLRELFRERNAEKLSDWKQYEKNLDKFDEFAQVTDVVEITKDLVVSFRQWRLSGDNPRRQPVSTATVNRQVMALQSILNWAAGSTDGRRSRGRFIQSNPIAGLTKLPEKLPPKPLRMMTDEEAEAMFKICPMYLSRFLCVLATTDLSPDQLLDLEFEDIDFETGEIELTSDDCDESSLTVDGLALHVLRDLRNEIGKRNLSDQPRHPASQKSESYVFVNAFSMPLHRRFYAEFYRYCRDARIKGGTKRGPVYPESIEARFAWKAWEDLTKGAVS